MRPRASHPNPHQTSLFGSPQTQLPVAGSGGESVAVFVKRPCVLALPHHTPEGERKDKIVGKLIAHPEHGLVFYHAHSGTQAHRKSGCPAPVDQAVIRFLEAQEVELLYIYDRGGEALYRAKRVQIGAARVEVTGNRRRHYLAEHCWDRRGEVREENRGYCRELSDESGILLVEPFFQGTPWCIQETRF